MKNLKHTIGRLFLKGRYVLQYINEGWYCCPVSKKKAEKLEREGKTTFKASFSTILEIEHNLRVGNQIIRELHI